MIPLSLALRMTSFVAFSFLLVLGHSAQSAPAVPGVTASAEMLELPGPVVIGGAGKLSNDVRDAFFAVAGDHEAKIVVITAIEPSDEKKAESLLGLWKPLKPAVAVILNIHDHKKAEDPESVKSLADATGVWIDGVAASTFLATCKGTLLEKEIRKLHARGGTIGGTSAGAAALAEIVIDAGTDGPKVGSGLGMIPGLVINSLAGGSSQVKQFQKVIADHPMFVGLEIGQGAGLKLDGRSMRVIGNGRASVYMAAGAGKEAIVQSGKSGDMFDLFQLRRAAANRASKTPFPPEKPASPEVKKGSLLIVGGGRAGAAIWEKFIELAGGPNATIVMIPTALEEPLPAVPTEVAALKRFGAKNVVVLHTRSQKEANDPKFSEVLTKAKGVWFGGGRQWRFVDAYAGTLTEKRIHEVLARGGVIGGSSAGASIQSEYMPRGHPLGNTVMAAEGYEKGFGFLPGCAVDQHFFARNRTADMTGLMKLYPQYLGIGIDEGTAIVVVGTSFEVIGSSKVAIYDTQKKAAGAKDYEEIKVGEKYDLKGRKKKE